jgi:RHS repeat-associated protein
VAENWYLPFGDTRYSSGTLPTGYTFTGQYSNTADFGWMYYKARWYDPSLGRFGQADTIIPKKGSPQSWDRYSYVKNNPILYNDPSGHCELVCALGIVMGGGAIVGAGLNIYSQYQENQSVNIDEVVDAAWQGAVIAGGGLVVVGGAALLAPAILADGDPTNEIKGVQSTIDKACEDGDCTNELTQAVAPIKSKIGQLADDVSDWLGDDLVSIRNKAGDFVLRNSENTRRFRFDANNTYPHENPHMHIEWINEFGEWINKHIFPRDVSPK